MVLTLIVLTYSTRSVKRVGRKNGFACFFCLQTTCFLVALNNLSSGKLLNVRVQQWLTLISEIPQNFHCDSVSHVMWLLHVTRGSSICMFHCSRSVMVWGLLEAKHRTQSPSVLVLYKLLVKRVHLGEAVSENIPTPGAGYR